MARKHRVAIKCACGIRVKLPRGAKLPACTHIAQSSIEPLGGWAGPADYFQFFEPRVDQYKKVRGGHSWTARKPSTEGRKHTPALFGKLVVQKAPPRPTSAMSIRVERESRRLAAQLALREQRRRTWAEILAHLSRATPKQIEAYQAYVLGKTIRQVADGLGIGERAAKDRIDLARRHERTSRRRAQMA